MGLRPKQIRLFLELPKWKINYAPQSQKFLNPGLTPKIFYGLSRLVLLPPVLEPSVQTQFQKIPRQNSHSFLMNIAVYIKFILPELRKLL
ncbi:hypothetical protein EBR78_05765 [bacterium]|nr:hypothetical protein [bacterium]NBX81853.1 hypothetical protein [bacterium]